MLVSNDSERSADEFECWHRAKANLENRTFSPDGKQIVFRLERAASTRSQPSIVMAATSGFWSAG